ncbi:hypothetical protein DL771_007646 [Monosporascus sp. 5C6A]|nr:hypothetical protein DL771_007646 [Monosporascus sp. 5C6A]
MLPDASLLWLTIASATAAELRPTWTPTTSVQAPLVSNCVNWYQAAHGDSCYSISKPLHLSILAFLSMNPQIHENCTLVLPHYWYCVRVDHMIDISSATAHPPSYRRMEPVHSSVAAPEIATSASATMTPGHTTDAPGSGEVKPSTAHTGSISSASGVMITEIEWVSLTKQVPFTNTIAIVGITTANTKR